MSDRCHPFPPGQTAGETAGALLSISCVILGLCCSFSWPARCC